MTSGVERGNGPDPEELRSRLQSALRDLVDPEDEVGLERMCANVLASISRTTVAAHLHGVMDAELDPKIELDAESVPDEEEVPLVERLRTDTRYRVLNEIERGGMGVVHRVWDRELRRILAMKVARTEPLSSSDTLDRTLLARFLEEAQITGQLDHPGIVPIHSLGLNAEGRLYFTMRLVKGETLKEVFERAHAGDEVWTRTRALDALLRVCEAVAYAHAKGVVHRDLKPANVMVGRFGEVYVMDWGVAKLVGRPDTRDLRLKNATETRPVHTDVREGSGGMAPDTPLVTMDGAVVGTPAYMAIEQARGEVEQIDARSDVYSLGAMLYELLAGRAPYIPEQVSATPHTILARILDGPPKPLSEAAPGTPVELEAICSKAMARDANARYADMGELAQDLRAFLENRVVKAYRTGAVVELRKWVERNRVLATTLSVSTLLILVAAVVSTALFRSERAISADLVLEKETARASERAARTNEARALRTQSLFLADLANQQTDLGDAATGLLLALEALPRDVGNPDDRPYVAQAEVALYKSLLSLRERTVLRGHEEKLARGVFNHDGSRILTTSFDGSAIIWDSEGAVVFTLRSQEGNIYHAAFNHDGNRIVTTSSGGTARLWDNDGKEKAVLRGHEGPVFYSAFSHDGNRIITAGTDGVARIWDSEGGEVAVLRGHEDVVLRAAFNHDGSRVVTASYDGTARIWDSEGDEVAVLRGHEGWVFRVAFSHDGSRIVTASPDGTARLWDSEGNNLAVLRGHDSSVVYAAFNDDGSRIVTASHDHTARLWNSEGKEVSILRGHQSEVLSAVFNHDGSRIVTASNDGTARLWDSEGEQVAVLRGHEGAVWSAAFSHDGKRVVTVSDDKTARLWDLESNAASVLGGQVGPVSSSESTFLGSLFLGSRVFGNRVLTASLDGTASIWNSAFSSDGSRILTASLDGTARIWDSEGEAVAVLRGQGGRVQNAAFSRDGSRVVTAGSDGTAQLWDSAGNEIAVLRGHEDSVIRAEFSHDGDSIVTCSADGTARLWDRVGREAGVLRGHEGKVLSAAFSQDDTRIVTTSDDGTARVWDRKGDEVAIMRGHRGAVWLAALNRDGSRTVTSDYGGTIRLWDSEGNKVAVLAGHELGDGLPEFTDEDTPELRAAAINQDGGRIVTASGYRTARLFDSAGNEVAVLRHESWVGHVAFSDDGRHIVTTSSDCTARIWDSAGAKSSVLRGHGNTISGVAFNHDGSRVVTASFDGTARVWDIDGNCVAVLPGQGGVILDAAFSPDGTQVVITPVSGPVKLFRVYQTQALIDLALEVAPRQLTEAQRERFFLGDAR